MSARLFDPTGFSDESLRLLLAAQEYPEGDVAMSIELEQQIRRARQGGAR